MRTSCSSRALLAAFAALGGFLSFANAQSVATTPVGAMTVNVQGGNAYTFIGPSFYRPATYTGVVSSVSGDGLTITLPSAALVSGSANSVVIGAETLPQFFIEVLDGSDVGAQIQVVSNTATSITLAENVVDFISAGTKIRLIPHHTLSSLLPAGGGLTGALTAASADEVFVYSPSAGAQSYFYRSSAPAQWRQGTVNNNLRPIFPNQAVYILRKGSAPASVTILGSVKDGTTALDISNGYNLLPNPYPVDLTLETSGLYTGNVTTGLKGALTAASADEVTIYQTNGSATTYFYRTSSPIGWRTGSTTVTNVPIPAGAAVMINRKAGNPPFAWVKAQPWTM